MNSTNDKDDIIKDLTNKMDTITYHLNTLLFFIDKFKNKKHIIVYSYLLGYMTSKKNINFNQDKLINSLDILNKPLMQKAELSNLIINIAYSLNKSDEIENKKKLIINENKKDKNYNEIINTNDIAVQNTVEAFNDLFGKTTSEKPLNQNDFNKNNINNKKNISIENNYDTNCNNFNNIENINDNINKNNNIINISNNANKPNDNNINYNNNIIFNENYNKESKDKKLNKNDFYINEIKDNFINYEDINDDNHNNTFSKKNKAIYINENNNSYIHSSIKNKKMREINIPYNEKEKIEIKNNTNNTINTSSFKNTKKNLTEVTDELIKNMPKCIMCSECLNESEKNFFKLSCKCKIHYKCFNKYIINSIKNSKIPILCPKCKNEINQKYIYKSLNGIGNKELIKKYEKFCINLYISNLSDNNTYYTCPGCKYYFTCDNIEQLFLCPQCKKEYCLKCGKPWHKDKKCQGVKTQKSNNKNNIEKPAFQLNKNDEYKECPKCQAIILKSEGTNKMVCFCGTTFCSECGKIIKENIHECK